LAEQYSGYTSRSDQHHSLHARDAAEALFKSKQSVKPPQTETSAPNTRPDQHEPRILPASPDAAVLEETPVSAVLENTRPAILDQEIAKIRTWIKYGMTVAEVAHVYGIATSDVKRALAQP
jgi:hypothetical protein